MTKNDLVSQLAQDTGLPQAKIESVLRALSRVVGDRLKSGEKVSVTGFGTFYAIQRSSRKVRNPLNGELMQVPAMKMPKFRAGEALKRSVR